ncbi:hypothetical protein M427DRAFT_356985 [Gonapodya prolifera JEL478]|uniref:Uncharacterized protein n=1 Tax=Gonapodya prolifera (strain JEL478) TaxID=1344416 RepID=A0A139AB34_GONPJ|nr:hypothetical protein M427DRAFT_356985 [Gonapodya prolifera JEL478]|eukprot:KXS14016.1 hypothetical protein M427DRAFT_356985 [Gonapodya prolifera JEL478]
MAARLSWFALPASISHQFPLPLPNTSCPIIAVAATRIMSSFGLELIITATTLRTILTRLHVHGFWCYGLGECFGGTGIATTTSEPSDAYLLSLK